MSLAAPSPSTSRRSIGDLEGQITQLLDLQEGSTNRTVHVKKLLELIQKYEETTGRTLLFDDEKQLVEAFSRQMDISMTKQDILTLFAQLSDVSHADPEAPSSPRSIKSSMSSLDFGELRRDAATLEADGALDALSDSSPSSGSASTTPSLDSFQDYPTPITLPRSRSSNAAFETPHSSPAPRNKHSLTQQPSSPLNPLDLQNVPHSTPSNIPSFANRSRASPLEARHIKKPVRRPGSAKNRRQSVDSSMESERSGSYDPSTPVSSGSMTRSVHSSPSLATPSPMLARSLSDPLFEQSQSEASLADEKPPAGFDGDEDVDTTSFHPHPLSPPLMPEAGESMPYGRLFGRLGGTDMARDPSSNSTGTGTSDESSRPVSVFFGEAMGQGMRPESIASMPELAHTVSNEDLHLLIRASQDDANKRIKELERTRDALVADHEADMLKMQLQLDDAQAELVSRRKEEKEFRGKEKQYQDSIMSLEAEVSKLQKLLDKHREIHANLKKQFEEQRGEHEKLRENLRTKEIDLKSTEDAVKQANGELSTTVQERNALQAKLHSIEAELTSAQTAYHYLELQKNENGKLKDTIDALKFEIDQLGARARLASTASVATVPRALRSLGSEMGSDNGSGSDGDKTEDESSSRLRFPSVSPLAERRRRTPNAQSAFDELPLPPPKPQVIMRFRNVIQRQRKSSEDQTEAGEGAEDETIYEEETLELEDRSMQTEAVLADSHETQTASPDPPPYDSKSIPIEHMAWNEWLVSLGQSSPYAAPVLAHIPPQYHHLLINGLSLLVCASVTSFATGLVTGAYFLGPTHVHLTSDAAWLAFNTLNSDIQHAHGWRASLAYWWTERVATWNLVSGLTADRRFLWRTASSHLRVPT